MKNKIQALMFDFDGTLVDTNGSFREMDKKLITKYADEQFHNYNQDQLAQEIEGKSIPECASYLKSNFNLSLSEEEIVDFINTEVKNIYKKTKLRPGVEDLLSWAKRRSIQCAICTSGSEENVEIVLKKTHTKQYFSKIISADDIERNKPFPDIYEKCVKVLMVDPAQCIAFEDSLSGLQAAKMAGIHTVNFRDRYLVYSNEDKEKTADFSCNNFKEAMDFVEKENTIKKAIAVIDVQYDKIEHADIKDGIIDDVDKENNLLDEIKSSILLGIENGADVYYTQDTHFEDSFMASEEAKINAPHCIMGEHGWKIYSQVFDDLATSYQIPINSSHHFLKSSLGCYELIDVLSGYDYIEFVGYYLDQDILSNVLSLRMVNPECEINIIDKATCVRDQKMKNSIKKMLKRFNIFLI